MSKNVKFVKALREQVPFDAKQVDIYLKDNILYFVDKNENENQMEMLLSRFRPPMEDRTWLI